MSLEGEVSGIEQDHLRTGNVSLVRLRARGNEERVILTPDREQRRLLLAKILLEAGVSIDIVTIVVENVELDVGVPRARDECGVESVAQRVDRILREIDARGVLTLDPGWLGDRLDSVSIGCGGVRPILLNRRPRWTQPFDVRIPVL